MFKGLRNRICSIESLQKDSSGISYYPNAKEKETESATQAPEGSRSFHSQTKE
jgi:hypothetical protein